MSQVNFLIEYLTSLTDEEACISIVTSGDIDAVTIHMFALSHLWTRKDDGKFKHPVYVLLQKAGGLNVLYNITKNRTFRRNMERRTYWNEICMTTYLKYMEYQMTK